MSSAIAKTFLFLLFAVHISSLFDLGRIAGWPGDPFTHAAMPKLYCEKILKWDLYTDQLLAPAGVSIANSYDSPFPLILTCPFSFLGSIHQYHLFSALQIFLILLSAWLVSGTFTLAPWWRVAYVLFAWWTGFYIARVYQHHTLLSGVWGLQLLLWTAFTLKPERRASMVGAGLVIGLVFSGTFHNIAMLTVPAVILLCTALIHQKGNIWNKTVALNLCLAVFASLAVFAFLFGPAVYGYFTHDLRSAGSDRTFYNLDLMSLALPWSENYIYSLLGIPPILTFERYNHADLLILLSFGFFCFRRATWQRPWNAVLISVAAFSWIISLGPEFRFLEAVIAENPIDHLLSTIPPFSFSRTPARFASLSVSLMVFIAIREAHARWSGVRWLPWVLIGWILVNGPMLNQTIRIPTLEYGAYMPVEALKLIGTSSGGGIVMNVPVAHSSDPTQNFMQLFHNRPITGGYLSYVSYTESALRAQSDPILSQMDCGRQPFSFRGLSFIDDFEKVRAHLREKNIRYVIFHTQLMADPRCGPLLEWSRNLAGQNWMRQLGEHGGTAVFEVLYSTQ